MTALSCRFLGLAVLGFSCVPPAASALTSGEAHVWDTQEITFQSAKGYANPYTEVECWVDLEGPGFAGRVYGFWDGGRTFKIRFVATAPGEWRWRSGSNQPDDAGLNGGRGRLRAVAWSEDEKRENANRRGFVRASANGRALQHADGTAADARITTSDGALTTAKDMADEDGNRPFAVLTDREGLADFDRPNPAYFRSLDRKMRHLADQGFVPFLETVRRDCTPSWKAYFDFNTSYARFVQYLIARYGAFDLVFSGIHLDWIPKDYSLAADEFGAVLTSHHAKYGGLPFGQPYTTLIDRSTYKAFGHGDRCPWLTMHTVGNKPRNHAIYASLEEIFRLSPPVPAANLEPYYTGWNHEINRPAGETPAPDSDRDNYFARAQMYGSVLSGGLAGHVHGTAVYDVTSTGEPPGWRPYIWEALRYASGGQMQHLQRFVLSEGDRYQQLELASADLAPRTAPDAIDDGLDGWAFMMRTADRALALLYFERKAVLPRVGGLEPGARYRWTWFDPRAGGWAAATELVAGADGVLGAPPFPEDAGPAVQDWAAKLTRVSIPSGPTLKSRPGRALSRPLG